MTARLNASRFSIFSMSPTPGNMSCRTPGSAPFVVLANALSAETLAQRWRVSPPPLSVLTTSGHFPNKLAHYRNRDGPPLP
jgi:hypothetical protein